MPLGSVPNDRLRHILIGYAHVSICSNTLDAAVPPGFRSTFRDWACRLSRNMLHAVLHGKLDESVPEPARLEDALTSTVFGALVWTGSWDLLAGWLAVKRIEGTKRKKSRGRKLSYQLPVGVETEPLYSLDSPEELRKLAGRVRAMWAKTNGGT